MNLRTLITSALLLGAAAAGARTPAEIFTSAPDSVFPLFSANARMDMADYYRYGLANSTNNQFGEPSRITGGGDCDLTIQAGANSSLQVAVLPQRQDTLVAVVETVLTPQADSGIRFYRLSDWKPVIPKNAQPSASDFLTDEGRSKGLPPMFFMKIEYLPEEDVFLFSNTSGGYYAGEEAEDMQRRLLPSLKRRFDGKSWKNAD